MTRTDEVIRFPSSSPGTNRVLKIHSWKGSSSSRRCYIQASLHADETPGMLVANHLAQLLNAADAAGQMIDEVVLVPFANPIGLGQQALGKHIGRFYMETGVNFNRQYPDISAKVIAAVHGKLSDDALQNTAVVREAIQETLRDINMTSELEDVYLKNTLFSYAAISDIVLDLHCDCDGLLYMFTHDRLWPALADLAADMGTHCQLLCADSGGNAFDEACSNIWHAVGQKYPQYSVPMGCEAATIELRGECDVSTLLCIFFPCNNHRYMTSWQCLMPLLFSVFCNVEDISPAHQLFRLYQHCSAKRLHSPEST